MGRLVPQDPDDEPASRLLERIEKEKGRLYKEGKIRKPKKFTEITEEEKPFEIPEGWVPVRYGDVVSINTGRLDANAAVDNGDYPFFTCSQTPSRIDHYEFEGEAVLLAGNGDFNVKMYNGKFNAYQRTYVIKPIYINLNFLYFLTIANIERITINNRGTAISYLRLADITMPVFSLPPLQEQNQIVAKLDELMALCDRLKSQLNEAGETQQRLAESIVKQAVA